MCKAERFFESRRIATPLGILTFQIEKPKAMGKRYFLEILDIPDICNYFD